MTDTLRIQSDDMKRIIPALVAIGKNGRENGRISIRFSEDKNGLLTISGTNENFDTTIVVSGSGYGVSSDLILTDKENVLKQFASWCKKLPNGEQVSITYKTTVLKFSCGDSTVIVQTDPDCYETPAPARSISSNAKHRCAIEYGTLVSLVKPLLKVATKDIWERKPQLNGLLVSCTGNQLTLVSTDGYTLAERTVPVTCLVEDPLPNAGLLTANTLNAFLKTAKPRDKKTLVDICFGHNNVVSLVMGDTVYSGYCMDDGKTRILSADDYPDHTHLLGDVINAEGVARITVDKKSLDDILKGIPKNSSLDTKVLVSFGDELTLTLPDETTAVLRASGSAGGNVTKLVRVKWLRQAIATLDGDKVTVCSIDSKYAPVALRGVGVHYDKDYTLVMPTLS